MLRINKAREYDPNTHNFTETQKFVTTDKIAIQEAKDPRALDALTGSLDIKKFAQYARLKSGSLAGEEEEEGGCGYIQDYRTPLTLHLALVVDDHTTVILEVDEHTILPPPGLALPHHNRRHHCSREGNNQA